MNFKDFINRISALSNYELLNGKINVVIIESEDKILYDKNVGVSELDLKTIINLTKEKNCSHIDIDSNSRYYICSPILRKEDNCYRNIGFVLITDIMKKSDIQSLLIVSEFIAFIIINSVENNNVVINMGFNINGSDFTEREVDVIKLIANGYSDEKIQSLLLISRPTLRTHIKNIFIKTDTSSRSEIVRYYFLNHITVIKDKALFFTFDSS